MFSRTSTRWLAPIVILTLCGVAFAYNRISATNRSTIAADAGHARVADAPKKPRPMTAWPRTNPDAPDATEWVKYPADCVLPKGIAIGITDGVITGVVTEHENHPDYELLGTRYVIGDIDGTDITMPLWRHLDLEMQKTDGTTAELSVLRPLWWIEETGAKEGGGIDLGLQEIGVSGMAKVLKIRSCDVDSRDNPKGTNVVTGKIKHHNAEVWDLVFNSDTAKPLGVTANHPIYSFDRDDWIPAGELRLNEKVKTLDGTATLTSKSKRSKRETVYNLEVHRSHAYHVSQLGILAHNNNIIDCSKAGVTKLIHYTDEAGMKGILDSNKLLPSLKSINPKDVRYGNGQYLTDILPGSKTQAQLSRALVGHPFSKKFTHYVEIDVTGLQAIKGRNGVFVIPNDNPLELIGRIVGSGGL